EQHAVRRPGGAQPEENVLTELLLAQGWDVVAQLHALNQLLHVRTVEDLVELRLPDEDHVQDLFLARFEPREHAYFFDRFLPKFVSLMANQRNLLVLQDLPEWEGFSTA